MAIGRASVEPLIARLGDEYSFVRPAVYKALGKLGEGRLANAVIGTLYGDAKAREELGRLATQGDMRVVEPLIAWLSNENPFVRKVACEALSSIYKTVEPRIGEILCRTHLTKFEQKTIQSNGVGTVSFLACRICGKSDQAMFGAGEIIATIDAGMEEEFICANGVVRGNWLKRVDLFDFVFDFDRVEIIQASDYDVERFCIQVGNDMDGLRRKKYHRMPCIVYPQCGLSESTMNMLRARFGDVSAFDGRKQR